MINKEMSREEFDVRIWEVCVTVIKAQQPPALPGPLCSALDAMTNMLAATSSLPPAFLDLLLPPLLPLFKPSASHPWNVREATLRCLNAIFRVAKTGCAPLPVWRELWVMVLSTLEREKVKQDSNMQVYLAGIGALRELLPVRYSEAVWDWDARLSSSSGFFENVDELDHSQIQVLVKSEGFRVMLARTISVLLDVASGNLLSNRTASYSQRIHGIHALDLLLLGTVDNFDALANVFPGIASTLATCCLEPGTKATFMAASIDILTRMSTKLLNNDANSGIVHVRPLVTSIMDLSRAIERDDATDASVSAVSSDDDDTSTVVETPASPVHSAGIIPPQVNRDRAWLKSTQQRLVPILRRVLERGRRHQHSHVRLAALTSAYLFVRKTNMTLKRLVRDAVETVALLSLDEINKVALSAKTCLEELVTDASLRPILSDVLYKNFAVITSWNPRDDDVKENIHDVMDITRGMLQVLPRDIINEIIRCFWSQENVGSWIQLLETLDQQGREHAPEKSLVQWDATTNMLIPSLHSMDVKRSIQIGIANPIHRSSEVENVPAQQLSFKCHALLSMLARKSDPMLLSRHVLTWWRSNQHSDATKAVLQTGWIRLLNIFVSALNEAPDLSHNSSQRTIECQQVSAFILRHYTHHPALTLPTSRSLQRSILHLHDQLFFEPSYSALTDDPELPDRVITCVLALLEGIRMSFPHLPPRHRDIAVIDLIYPILEKLGDDNPEVQIAATHTLETMTRACNAPSPREFLLDNIDRVVDTLSLHIRQLESHPLAPTVLTSCLRVVGPAMIPHLDDILEEVLEVLEYKVGAGGGSGMEREWLAEGLLRVLEAIVDAHAAKTEDRSAVDPAWAPAMRISITSRKMIASAEAMVFPEIQAFIDSYRVSKTPVDELDIICSETTARMDKGKAPMLDAASFHNDNKEDDSPKAITDDAPPAPTPSERQSLLIFPALLSHITSASPTTRAYTVSILTKTTSVLFHRHELLPLLHDAWPRVLSRLDDTDPRVRLEVVQWLEVMMRDATAAGFLVARVERDVWRKLRPHLRRTQHWRDFRDDVWEKRGTLVAIRVCLALIRKSALGVEISKDIIWEMLFLTRHGLAPDMDQDVKDVTETLFHAAVNQGGAVSDIAWMVLHGFLGTEFRPNATNTSLSAKTMPSWMRWTREKEEDLHVMRTHIDEIFSR